MYTSSIAYNTQWSKLSSTSQQLDCMQRHADGCGDLWNKQTGGNNSETSTISGAVTLSTSTIPNGNNSNSSSSSNGGGGSVDKKKSTITKSKPNDWVVIPVFADIVCLALTARDDCQSK